MHSAPLRLEVRQDRTFITRETVAKRILEIVVTAPEPETTPERLPLNLALVLDRSGSMAGDKLPFVQQAACHLLDQLRERDQVSVVSFDSIAEVLAPNGPVSASVREQRKRTIRALTPRGGTDLFSGWLHGANETASHTMPQGVNRVLLLTDGQANEGESRQEVLQRHAQELRQRGVSTSTFGVGQDFNQYLLEGMAEHGGGHYYFIEHPDQIPALFRRELGELMTVIARSTLLEIKAPAGTSLSLLGELPHEQTNSGLTLPLGELFAGEQRCFYLEILTPTTSRAIEQTFPVELSWTDTEGVPKEVIQLARFTYATQEETWAVPADTTLRQRATAVRVAVLERTALRLSDEGNTEAAVQTVEKILSKYSDLLSPEKLADLNRLLQTIRSRSLSLMESKSRHSAEYSRRYSRS